MVCQFIFSTPFDRLYLPTSGGMYYAVRPPSTGAELAGAHEGAPRRNAFLPAERVGMEGNSAMRFPGIVLPRKMNKTKNSHKSPEKQRFPACKTCVPQTAQNAHTDTVWKIKEYRHIYYGIAETSKV